MQKFMEGKICQVVHFGTFGRRQESTVDAYHQIGARRVRAAASRAETWFPTVYFIGKYILVLDRDTFRLELDYRSMMHILVKVTSNQARTTFHGAVHWSRNHNSRPAGQNSAESPTVFTMVFIVEPDSEPLLQLITVRQCGSTGSLFLSCWVQALHIRWHLHWHAQRQQLATTTTGNG